MILRSIGEEEEITSIGRSNCAEMDMCAMKANIRPLPYLEVFFSPFLLSLSLSQGGTETKEHGVCVCVCVCVRVCLRESMVVCVCKRERVLSSFFLRCFL